MKAREYLQTLGVHIIEYDIEKDPGRREEMMRKSGRPGVPFLDIEGIYVHGFNRGKIKWAIEQRRSVY